MVHIYDRVKNFLYFTKNPRECSLLFYIIIIFTNYIVSTLETCSLFLNLNFYYEIILSNTNSVIK
jgi:hypothetical protein